MLSSRFRIVARLNAGFAAVLLLTAVMGALAIRTMETMADLAADFHAHPFQVTNALLQIESQVNAMRADMLLMIYTRAPGDVTRLAGQVATKETEMAASLAVVRSQYLGPRDDVSALAASLARWKLVRDRNIALCMAGDFDGAAENSRRDGGPQIVQLRADLATLYTFARNKADEFNRTIATQRDEAAWRIIGSLIGLLALGAILARLITRGIVRPLGDLRTAMAKLSAGELETVVPHRDGRDEIAEMARAVEVFKGASLRLDSGRWVKDAIAKLSLAVQETDTHAAFATAALSVLAPLTGAAAGLLHVRVPGSDRFAAFGGWGAAGNTPAEFRLGEGLAGQCAVDKTILVRGDLPETYLRVSSPLGEAPPRQIAAAPITLRGEVGAVLELATLSPFTDAQKTLINEALPLLALNLEILERNIATRQLLEETQAQAEELRVSEEELRTQGEALQTANEELRTSEEELRTQQEALQTANEELRLKGEALEERGRALELARAEADRRAVDLDQASRYKSEFLANMSHELRTPLNSLLILSKSLADNDEGTLTADQVESAGVVHDSGRHLLNLINEILDLSKVEAGKMSVNAAAIAPDVLATGIRRRFQPLADDKGLTLEVGIDADLPADIVVDVGKVEQIANNLVGNAIKFAAKGQVAVRFCRADPAVVTAAGLAGAPGDILALNVSDSGPGIAPADQTRIFRAFEQVDGSSSRAHGGTGLGLTISRQLARLMGGDVVLDHSAPGQGSSFTLLLPMIPAEKPAIPAVPAAPAQAAIVSPPPPTPTAAPAGRPPTLLIVEDDPAFRRIVVDLAVKRGYRTLAASDGVEGVAMARHHRPDGIVLDIGLPGLDGWGVIAALRDDPATKDIPVHVISAVDERLRAGGAGLVGFLTKPVSREQIEGAFERLGAPVIKAARDVLLVDVDAEARGAVARALAGPGRVITEAGSAAETLDLLRRHRFDCMVLDPALPDMNGIALLDCALREKITIPPLIVHSAAELSQDDALRLGEFTDSIVIQGGRSTERLRDEVSLFLHAVESRVTLLREPPPSCQPRDPQLTGRTVLVVDDDMRNAFALSKVLRGKGLKVLIAQDGARALSQIQSQERIDIVLMDIMMPGMDGYQAMTEIRRLPGGIGLPIIALTAKAMAGDRERCLRAGADDYMSKPVDLDRLLALMAQHLPDPDRAQPA